jgi:hypothetical protein
MSQTGERKGKRLEGGKARSGARSVHGLDVDGNDSLLALGLVLLLGGPQRRESSCSDEHGLILADR